MRLVPEQWTHHHSWRLFHLSLFFVVTYVIATALWGIFWTMGGVSAQVVVDSDSATVTGEVIDITLLPPTTGGGGSGPPGYTPAPYIQEGIAYIEPVGAVNEEVTIDGVKRTLPVFTNQYPAFKGAVPYRNAAVFLRINSSVEVRSVVFSDYDGKWNWGSLTPIAPGLRRITASVQNGESLQQLAFLDFYIRIPDGQVEIPSRPPPVRPSQPGTMLDVSVKIPSQFKIVAPEDELVATIEVVNFGANRDQEIEVPVQYTLTDADGRQIIERTETVRLKGRASIIKTFEISRGARNTTYTLTVQIPSGNLIAISSDTFEVKDKPVLGFMVNVTLLFQWLMIVLGISLVILYFEYNKVAVLNRIIRQISERDLRREM